MKESDRAQDLKAPHTCRKQDNQKVEDKSEKKMEKQGINTNKGTTFPITICTCSREDKKRSYFTAYQTKKKQSGFMLKKKII